MEKFTKFLKNFIIFFAIFLAINFIFQSFQNDPELPLETYGDITITTKDTEYSRLKTVVVELTNNTEQEIVLKNECPNEPLNVFRKEDGQWVQKTISPEIHCENAKDITLVPHKKTPITYENWNYALFSSMGTFHIELVTEEKTYTSNEFQVVEEGILKKLWNAVFYKPIYNALILLITYLPYHDLGFAIILLTILIRTILLIPNNKAMRSQQKLQDIQPKLEKIKEKYKGDQQKISLETMNVWKEGKVNPLGSCLPMLLQFPFLIALFYVIKGGLNPDNAHLLYTNYQNFDFHNINVIFLGILDLTKANIYVLPFVIGGLQFIQLRLTTNNNKKKENKDDKKDKKKNELAAATGMMTYFMPVMIAVFTASLPAGVGLYWGISTSYGILQQIYVNKTKTKSKEKNDDVKVTVIESK